MSAGAIVRIIGKCTFLGLRMASVWPYVVVAKRRAKKHFVRELQQAGMNTKDVTVLSKAYMDIVPINPTYYLRATRRR